MFGSTNPFGQSSSSPFGSSVFGQTSSPNNNPFAPKPFGSPNPFGSQTGSSLFGGTSTGVFGQPSTPAFGASSSPAFGSSTPAFGASSTPAFGSSSSSFGGSSLFGQKPPFGGFGSTPGQTNPFGGGFQQTQPAFGSNPFGSTPTFGASSQPAFGATSTLTFGSSTTPAFGASSTPAFGATSAPAFGATSTPSFGSSTTPAFGSAASPLFGSTGTAFGASSTPAFGASSTTAFGAPSTSLFGSSSTPAFGAASTPTFGSSSAPAFGASSTPSFSFGSTPSFGQSTSTFGSAPFGSTPSPFGAQSSPFGAQATTPTFGSPGFGQQAFGAQRGGTRVASFTPTPEVDGGTGTQPAGKLESISAMPVYKDKSHEELRWEDYQLGDKGGPNAAGQTAPGVNFSTTQPNPFGSTSTFGQTASNPFSSSSASNPFAPKTPSFGSSGFGSSSTIFNPSFSAASSSPFGSTTTSTSLFGASSVPGFGSTTSPSILGGTTTPAFGSSPSFFGTPASGSSSSFGSSLNFGNTQSSGLFQSSTPSLAQTPSPFGQPTTGFQQSTPAFGSSLFSTPSTGFGGSLFSSSTPSLLPMSNPSIFGQTTPSLSSAFQPVAPAPSSTFSFGNFAQPQPAPSSGFGSMPNMFSQGAFGQSGSATHSSMVMQPAPVTNPFGTLPAMPQMSIGRAGSSPSVQYGISTMPVAEKPLQTRISSLVVPRHLSQRRIRLPARKYHPKNDGPKVPFFMDDEETPSTPKADALFIPRENPRALVIRPIEQWPPRTISERENVVKDSSAPVNENGSSSGMPSAPVFNGSRNDKHVESSTENTYMGNHDKAPSTQPKPSLKSNGVHENHAQKDSSYITLSGHRAGEAAIVYEHGADIEALMPKLRHADYYTEPRIQELAAKERAEPGFCRHVKDFVVGRHGYGSIKFDGETDVRRLDLESLIQFNNREVIVYKDESKKPPVGQGLNKSAEVTLLNIKCMNKKTGLLYTEGPKVEKYREMLKKKAEEQGAEFVSYDPVKGEWKFRVKHFSRYEFGDGDEGYY
ncbi:nuclear pore complex protein Nup98-Nup96 protein [Dioscorea alata]|uniref:Nuclear pore complex protein Nup98-Nup96 protein n=1 Tax=Dioscorea alata TaxID=55571 RepID=A0ACB7U4T4_DIOAL|nr:nuclear pore complex protein Nup98-Nup96 protein [Dioscorea alata]